MKLTNFEIGASPIVIEEFSKLLIGEDVFHKALELITTLDSKSISNTEKKHLVLMSLQEVGAKLGTTILSIGIDLVVLWLRQTVVANDTAQTATILPFGG
jgi:hypothetical protein